MTSGTALREDIIEALRRDLVGPLVDPSGKYPGSDPHLISENSSFESKSEVRYLFQARDDQEVLPYRPISRYGVGVLYPNLYIHDEEELQAEQTPPVDEEFEGDEADTAKRNSASSKSKLPDESPKEPLEPSEEIAIPRSPRPSAIGVSFVITEETPSIQLQLTGGRYEPYRVIVAGSSKQWWHRVDISHPITFEVPRSGVTKPLEKKEETLQDGALSLVVGAVFRRTDSEGRRVVTCYIRNISSYDDELTKSVLFQARLQIELSSVSFLQEYRQDRSLSEESKEEDQSLRLLYRDQPVRAVGHGCAASVTEQNGKVVIATESFPASSVKTTSFDIKDVNGELIEINMKDLAQWDPSAISAVQRMIEGYGQWISTKENMLDLIPEEHWDIAKTHLERCRNFLANMKEGWQLAEADPDVRQCLQWTSQAMAWQQLAYQSATRKLTFDENSRKASVEGIEPTTDASKKVPCWRGFQFAFLLANLPSIIYPEHHRRDAVDVIWMPTGGGKTEAYLAVAALTILWQRLHDIDNTPKTVVLMRYTLRLLTAQQLQRAASLICAMEVIRRKEKEGEGRLGENPFTVGAWLGSTSTPNRREEAIKQLNDFNKNNKRQSRPFLLSRCPWCSTALYDQAEKVRGYSVQHLTSSSRRVQAHCPNPVCYFHLVNNKKKGLPVYEVDEDIYKKPPSFLLGTVDKFAQLAWRSDTRSIFGIDQEGKRTHQAPDLIIQDELHLITGPLGSLVGLYETGIARLCEHDGGRHPRILASTATPRAYKSQIKEVFFRDDVRLVPPPGIDIEDSYFAHVDESLPSRKYIGVCAGGLNQFSRVQTRVIAALAHAAGILAPDSEKEADFYWTNVLFFGSLRDLGVAKSLLTTDLKIYQWHLANVTGTQSGDQKKGKRSFHRYLFDIELTSASSQSASEALERLQLSRTERSCVDVALATSVIEVGVDVPRLGLLTIVHQPKMAASYIQVSGRVGRSADGPGLVVVLLDPHIGRDISHYERFIANHDRFYEAVEPATVTPFTDATLERGLRGVVASIVRQTRDRGDSDPISRDDIDLAERAVNSIADRRVTGDEADDLAERIRDQWQVALEELRAASDESLPWGMASSTDGKGKFLRPLDSKRPKGSASWPVLTSLRNVDKMAALQISDRWIRVAPTIVQRLPGATSSTVIEEEDEDIW